MKLLCLLICILSYALPLKAKIDWQTDYMKVRKISQKENKPVLLFFNGSDWAGAAMKMKHEILDSSIFQDKIGVQFICMEVDFPVHTLLPAEQAEQNLQLKNRFKIQDFPSLILLDSHERTIAQVDYLSESGDQLANDLLKMLEQDAELTSGLQNLKNLTVPQLKKIYLLAQELNRAAAIEQILDAGFTINDPFFCLEKYRLLVENGEMKTEQALCLRQKLLSFAPDYGQVNGQGIPFTVALIDFQGLSQASDEPEKAVQPLLEYLANFGAKDPENTWQIEMMVAEIFLDADRLEEALKHAEKAYQTAPTAMHEKIARSLNYIKEQNPR